MKDTGGDKANSERVQAISFKNNVSLCAVAPVEGEHSEVLQECPSERPLALSSSLRSSPVGPAVCLCDIFICRTAMPPQRDWMLGYDLVFSNFVPEELPREVCSQAVFLQPPTTQLTAPPHSSLLGPIYFRSHNPLQSRDASSFFMFCPVDTYYSSAAFAAQSPMFCLQGSSTERV